MGILQINKSVFWWWNFDVRWWNSVIVYLPLIALNRRSFLFVIFDDHQLFFHGGNFQMIRAKKWVLMSAHHISVTFSSLLKLWWNCDANVIRIFFCPITLSLHFYHNVVKMCLAKILWWICDSHFHHIFITMSGKCIG